MQSEESFTENVEALNAAIKDKHEQAIKYGWRITWLIAIVAGIIAYFTLYVLAKYPILHA